MLKRLSLFAFAAVLLVACSSKEEEKPRSFDESLSAFINNEQIIAFGHVGLQGILDKADYKSNPMLQAFAAQEIEKVNKELDLNTPLYFALEGPMKSDGSPEKAYIIFKVKDKVALIKDLESSRGFMMEKSGDIDYTEDGDFVLAIKEDMAIAVVQSGDYEAKNVAENAFKMTEGDMAKGKIDDLLKTKGDIVVNMNLGAFADASKESMKQLNVSSEKEMNEMIEDSYMQVAVRFEKGEAVIETKNLFSEKLKKQIAFKSLPAPIFAKKLVDDEGDVIAAATINADISSFGKFMSQDQQEMMSRFESMAAMFTMMNEGISMESIEGNDKIIIPGTGKAMGAKGVELFIDFGELPQEMAPKGSEQFLDAVDYVTFKGDDEGFTLTIKTTRQNENFLKTVMDVAFQSFAGLMGGMSMM